MKDEPERRAAENVATETRKMAGTTRSNVDFFMRKFKKLGFIADEDGLTVNNSLLSVVLHE